MINKNNNNDDDALVLVVELINAIQKIIIQESNAFTPSNLFQLQSCLLMLKEHENKLKDEKKKKGVISSESKDIIIKIIDWVIVVLMGSGGA